MIMNMFKHCVKALMTCLIVIPALIYRCFNPELWLIGSRPDEADGNALAFYNWVKDKQKCVFVLNKEAPQYQNGMIPWNGIRHFFYSAVATVHIFDGSGSCSRFSNRLRELFGLHSKQVFLSHGVTQSNIPMYHYSRSKFDLITVVSKKEYEYVNKVWGYPEENIALTGFARHDYLIKNCSDERYVLIMPTWRNEFKNISDEDFVVSRFFKEYQSLLNNKQFLDFLKGNNLKLRFYLHYMIKDKLRLFSCSDDVEIYDETNSVHELLRDCSLLITDYSSVSFDSALIGKPIIYYQFQDCHLNQQDSYFKYDVDGFGPVVCEENELIQEIQNLWNGNKFEQKQLYIDRRDSFFEFNDTNNCQRIYDCILKINELHE